MASIDDLKTARDNVAARIKEITASPKPSYEIDGQSVDWNDYLKTLLGALKDIDEAITDRDPYFITTQVFTPDEPQF